MKRRSPVLQAPVNQNEKNGNAEDNAPSTSPSEPAKLGAGEVFAKPAKPPRGTIKTAVSMIRGTSVIVSPVKIG